MTGRQSRYYRQSRLQVPTGDGTAGITFVQRDTTVFEPDRPTGTRLVRVEAGSAYPEMAARHLGSAVVWYRLADLNPEVFYPLDLRDADLVFVPPVVALR